MSKFPSSTLLRYGIATVAVASALILTLLLGTTIVLQPNMLFLVAVMISAWYGGLRSGLLSLILSAMVIGYFFLPPAYSFAIGLSDTLRMILFAVVAAPISLIASAQKRSEETLWESEELHRITLSNISDAIFLTDGKGDFTYVCPNAHVIFGYSEPEVEAFGNICRLLGKGWFDPRELETAGEITNIEREIADKAGARHVVLVNVKRVAIKGATVLYTCREITQRKRAEEEHSQRIREQSARAEAEAANRAKDEFLAMVSHELRSPLNAMLPGKGMALLPSPSPKNRACCFRRTRLKHFKRPLRRTRYSNRSCCASTIRLCKQRTLRLARFHSLERQSTA